MRISALITGILFIIGAAAEHELMPKMMDKLNTLTNNLEASFLPQMPNAQANLGYSSTLSEMNGMTGKITSMTGKFLEYSSWASILAGIGMVTYGVLAKNNRTKILQLNEHESPLQILKGRLAKGEITKKEFAELKDDVV
jgi:uncharacterized membrane protein